MLLRRVIINDAEEPTHLSAYLLYANFSFTSSGSNSSSSSNNIINSAKKSANFLKLIALAWLAGWRAIERANHHLAMTTTTPLIKHTKGK